MIPEYTWFFGLVLVASISVGSAAKASSVDVSETVASAASTRVPALRAPRTTKLGSEASSQGVGPISVERRSKRWWGFPDYGWQLDVGPSTWTEFARRHGHLGRTCTVHSARKQCGTSFICKNGACISCTESRDCGEKFRCELPDGGHYKLCIPRDLQRHWSWREVVCTVLIIVTAMLSAAAGMGGGGVYVPLCLLLLGLSTKEAVPLSQAMIVGGAVVNIVMFCGDRHPSNPQQPKIDYNVIMMLNPGLAAGVTIGVIANVVSPQWFIIGVLLITLIVGLQKSLAKGIQQWKKESAAFEALAAKAKAEGSASVNAGGAPAKLQIKLADFHSFLELAPRVQRPIQLIAGCWIVFFVLNLLKAPQCSPMHWLQLLAMLAVCAAFTLAGAREISCKAGEELCDDGSDGRLAWTPRTMRLYPLLSTVAGFLGGFLGIGGGIIMGPLLLELGLPPEVSQATTAMFVLLSSSLATVQFVVLGKAMPAYAFWFTTWVVMATFVGQTMVDYGLRKWQRSSPIVLSIAAIISGSLVMMVMIGSMDIVTDIRRGADMGFAPHQLCAR